MKYGIVLFQDTENIGDDIQTYAASQFLPRVDYIIDRDAMDEFIPKKKEYVTAIMNGWYTHKRYHFPFSPYINPLLISMHFAEPDVTQMTEPGYQFLDGYTKEFLSKYGKIGCRDESTEKALKELGYDAYFSGCMTLTLNKVTESKRGNYICVCMVDRNPDIIEKLKSVYPDVEIKEIDHILEPGTSRLLTFEERMERVKEYLATYQNAKLVVTDRLHVSLPCLALETPVLLIYKERFADRLGAFKDYVTHCTEEAYYSYTNKDFEQIQNPTQYKKIRNQLKRRVKQFIKDSENNTTLNISTLPTIKEYQTYLKRQRHVENLLVDRIKHANQEINDMKEKNRDLQKQVNDLIEENNKANLEKTKVINRLESIENSRSFKIYNMYFKWRKGEK